MRKGLILKDSHKDLNLSQNTKASLGKSNITDIFCMSDKPSRDPFSNIIFENGEGRTAFYFPW